MTPNNEVEPVDSPPAAGTIDTPVPGLIFADPVRWARTLETLEGSMVEVLLEDGQSTLGHVVRLADNPDDEDGVDVVLHSEWVDGPAGTRIPIPFHQIAVIHVL